jgi:hypothetical protein
MTVLFELGAAVAVALACALHMLWRMRHGKRARDATWQLVDRQRLLAKRVETLSRNGSAPHRH